MSFTWYNIHISYAKYSNIAGKQQKEIWKQMMKVIKRSSEFWIFKNISIIQLLHILVSTLRNHRGQYRVLHSSIKHYRHRKNETVMYKWISCREQPISGSSFPRLTMNTSYYLIQVWFVFIAKHSAFGQICFFDYTKHSN